MCQHMADHMDGLVPNLGCIVYQFHFYQSDFSKKAVDHIVQQIQQKKNTFGTKKPPSTDSLHVQQIAADAAVSSMASDGLNSPC